MKIVPEKKWARADKARAKGVEAYIEFGQALAQIDATQEEIAARYDISQPSVNYALAVGRDKRFISNTYIPKSQHALYLLTTLDDEGFAELAKPETKQADILAYKRRLSSPDSTTRPAAPPSRPQPVPAMPEKARKTVDEIIAEREARPDYVALPNTEHISLEEALEYFGLKPLTSEVVTLVTRARLQTVHPDKGGNSEEFGKAKKLADALRKTYCEN